MVQNESPPAADRQLPANDRRTFFVKIAAGAVGLVAGLVPAVVALLVFLDPLRRNKSRRGNWIRITTLDALPADGMPYRFKVIERRLDAWTLHLRASVGAVYLRRASESEVPRAYSDECPHLGCSVAFEAEQNRYHCPCHNSTWNVDARRIDPANCPSPRDLDELDVEIRSGEVFANFQRFQSGIAKKVPV